MNQLSVQNLRTHVPILGWLLIVSNAILFVLGAFLFLLLLGIGVASGEREAMGILFVIGTALAGLLTVLGVPGVLAGIGLLRRRNWGRVLAIIVNVLGLLNFPIGTLIGLYTLWVLLQNSAEVYFSGAALD